MLEGRRGGERRRHAPSRACTGRRHERSSQATRDASFTRSFGPCTLILTMLRGESHGGGASEGASRSGKPAQAGTTGTGAFTNERSAARRVSPLPQGRRRDTSRKGRRLRSPSLRGSQEPGFSCSHVVVQLQKSVGDVWSRISSANALQKERQGRVNGGLARSEGRRVKPSAVTSSETRVESRPHRQDGRGPAQDPG